MLSYLTDYNCLVPLLAGLATYQSCLAAPVDNILEPPESLDAPMLLGPDNHPIPAHVAEIYTSGASFHFSISPQAESLNNLNLVLLALAKCTDGKWITSLFQDAVKPDQADDTTHGSATIVLAKTAEEDDTTVWNQVTVDRANFENIHQIIKPDIFEDIANFGPWWPWAFAEGTLKSAGDTDEEKAAYFEPAHILQTVSGVRTIRLESDLGDNEAIWKDHLSQCLIAIAPLYSSDRIMTTTRAGTSPRPSLVKVMIESDIHSVKCDNLDSESNQNGILLTELKYTELAEHVKAIVHLDGHVAFGGARTAHPGA